MQFGTKFVKELLEEVERLESENNTEKWENIIKTQEASLDNEAKLNAELSTQLNELTKENAQLKAEVETLKQNTENSNETKLRKELQKLKENMKKPVTIGFNSLEIFKKIKEGEGCIQPIHSTKEGWTTLKKYPFTFELGNMGCVFEEVELKGCFERNGQNRTYFYHSDASENLNREIVIQILGCTTQEAYDCNIVTKTSTKQGRKLRGVSWKKTLKNNITFNVIKQRFVSSKSIKFVYTKRDGSKYIVTENGEEEIL